jgi:hypothetical protein
MIGVYNWNIGQGTSKDWMEFNRTFGWDRYEWMGPLDRIQCWVGLNGSWTGQLDRICYS